MNDNPVKRTLVLVAVGLLTTTTGLASSTAQAETCQIPDPETQPGGEVALPLNRLQMAQQLPSGKWRVTIHASNLAGLDVPSGVDWVAVHLTGAQYNEAIQGASSANSKTVVFAVHSEAWVEEMEERLMGGFSIQFSTMPCRYNQPWS